MERAIGVTGICIVYERASLKEIRGNLWIGLIWLKIGTVVVGFCVKGYKPLGSTTSTNFIDQMNQ
jgi:hypothetical protein